jgi:hypothetical protein
MLGSELMEDMAMCGLLWFGSYMSPKGSNGEHFASGWWHCRNAVETLGGRVCGRKLGPWGVTLKGILDPLPLPGSRLASWQP